jgi:hypothetical protein
LSFKFNRKNIYLLCQYTSPWSGFEITTLLVIGTDCIGSCKSNCHTITATMTPPQISDYIWKHQIIYEHTDVASFNSRWFSPGPPFSSTNKDWPLRYNWNIVESGVKHHQTNKANKHLPVHHPMFFFSQHISFSYFKIKYIIKPSTCRKSLPNFYHIMLYTSPWSGFEITTLLVIGTDCIGSCKSNCHTITVALSTIKQTKQANTYLCIIPCFFFRNIYRFPISK